MYINLIQMIKLRKLSCDLITCMVAYFVLGNCVQIVFCFQGMSKILPKKMTL